MDQRCRMLTIDGTTKSLTEWSMLSCVSYATIAQRLMRGWDPERAVFAPSNKSTYVGPRQRIGIALPSDLVSALNTIAYERRSTLTETVSVLLRRALEEDEEFLHTRVEVEQEYHSYIDEIDLESMDEEVSVEDILKLIH